MKIVALAVLLLAAAPRQENALSPEERQAGWKLLFDGKSTAGWRGYRMDTIPPGWKAEDGVLARVAGGAGGKGAGGGDDIVSVEEYDDFELVLEWKVRPKGNSGVLFRVVEQSPTSWHEAVEMQILDNGPWPNRSKKELAGAAYDMVAPAKDVTRPVGEWNRARLVADGPRIEHWLNGEKLLEYEIGSDDWNRRLAAGKFKDKPLYAKATKGRICLQDHSDRIEFRNIKIRPLPPQ
jgi:cytochrome c